MFNDSLCIICAMPCSRHLCKEHRKHYTFDKRYSVFKLKPKHKISKGQNDLFKHIRSIYKQPTLQEVTFEWNPYCRYDIAVPDSKLIVEFDGQQHFIYNKLFHKSQAGFKDYMEKDKQKQSIAEMYGWKVMRFSYIEHVEDIEYVKKAVRLK